MLRDFARNSETFIIINPIMLFSYIAEVAKPGPHGNLWFPFALVSSPSGLHSLMLR
jgi:hypothetical protein